MGSVIEAGFYDDSDPIYQEGFTIVAPKKSKKKSKKSKLSLPDNFFSKINFARLIK